METKVCTKCNKEKLLSEFSRHKTGKDGFHSQCKACQAEYAHDYFKANKEKVTERNRNYAKRNQERLRNYRHEWRKKRRFFIALTTSRKHARHRGHAPCNATEKEIREAFTGFCHACEAPEIECNRKLTMDHNHETGEFRGWLCENCNKTLGHSQDSIDRMLALVEYLEYARIVPNGKS